ncbi:alpha-1,3-mannosyl-glycoprotein 4-beta-N-acetylglucosaminyltransferase B [Caerostris extrusa]|uniref:Alpha-1,3-mannosyl-glycoprotein 4-beta-N-acetylglucosaminyltransferase B n=1 Tax=Caerostris extrusa TaxID=172846 RepID=A0AAV4X8T2_CAEEX|nr:alpha-1,3-mannosyl-glycoprotein 4-beta-N-acetylglucosaminyltransferase B [Caerostris extrusa]
MYGKNTFNKKNVVIGIPTISRRKENYLHQTLQSVIDSMNPTESSNVTILVLFVDTDPDLRRKRAKETAYKFTNSVKSGLLLLYQVLPEFYPQMSITRRTYNDSIERIKWRSKQVLDFAFLLMHSQNLSEYFLILEDDVITTPHFITSIQKFVQERDNSDWVKPVDLLIMQFLDLLVPSKAIVTRRVPGLFQHIGLFSSLEGKVQKAKDRSFTSASRMFHFDNPPADIVTTLGVYKKHYPELCYYDSNKFFWGSAPKKKRHLRHNFQKARESKKRIYISSGLATHKDDVVKFAELKVSPLF